jgi:alpha-L-rhamnosidase
MKHYCLLLTLLGLLFSSFRKDEKAISVEKARCEFLQNPEGIDVVQPRLSWQVSSKLRAVNQTAYQILVASSKNYWHKTKVIYGILEKSIQTRRFRYAMQEKCSKVVASVFGR